MQIKFSIHSLQSEYVNIYQTVVKTDEKITNYTSENPFSIENML